MKKRKLVAALLGVFSIVAGGLTPAHAEIDYSEFWSPSSAVATTPTDKDKLMVGYMEAGSDVGSTNRIIALDDKTGEWISTCLELGKAPCEQRDINRGKIQVFAPSLIMPMCSRDNSPDCLESLAMILADGTRVEAEFLRYAEGISYPPNKDFNLPKSSTHPIFRVPGVLNAGGTDTYAVEYSQSLVWSNTGLRYEDLKVAVIPFVEVEDPNSTVQRLDKGPGPDGKGMYAPQPWNFPGSSVFMEEGTTARIANFGEGTRVEVVIHAHTKFGGWLRGRLAKADFEATQISSSQQRLLVAGTTVEVPRIMGYITKAQFLKYTPFPIEIFDRHVGNGVGGDVSDPDGVFGWLSAIRAVTKDKAAGVNRVWMFATVPTIVRQECYKVKGIQGLVATNSAVYAGAAPKFEKGFLNYRVGGLHYLPDGSEAIGSYDLVMRSDIARCLYGFSKAPVSGTVTVSGDGDTHIATTTVGEKNGWLKLSANGFTFSTKTIKVKLTQKKQTTITCVASGKTSKKVTGSNPKCPAGYRRS